MSTEPNPPFVGDFLRFMEEMQEQGFEEQDRDYVIRRFWVTKENRILSKGEQYPDPFAWQLALERARAEEKEEYSRLTTEHGYPDTQGMEWREGHQTRLRHLMTKYPSANWDLLLRGQFEGRDRKPSKPKSEPVTIQRIEREKQRLLALSQQQNELEAYGHHAEAVEQIEHSLSRVKRVLDRMGLDVPAFLDENKAFISPVPLTKNETERLKARAVDIHSLVGQMQEASEGDEDSALLVATRNVLSRYTETLSSFGVDVPTLLEVAAEQMFTSENIKPEPEPEERSEVEPEPEAHVLSDAVLEPSPTGKDEIASVPTDSNESSKKTLTPAEVADIMGISYKSALRHIKSGKIPYGIKVGRWLVDEAQFYHWLKGEQEQQKPAEQPVAATHVGRDYGRPDWDDGSFTPSF